MNYQGNEPLRVDIATLAHEMYELHIKLRELSRTYFWNSEVLTERLAGQILQDAHTRYFEIHKSINELDNHFWD